MAAVELNQLVMAWWISAHLLSECFRVCCDEQKEIWAFFQRVSSSTSEETPTWPGRRHQIYRHAFPFTPRSPIEISVAVILFFFSFLNISHFLSSRPFLCFRFSHYRAAVMFLCSSTTLPPQKLIVWNYAVGCKSLLVHCNWLLLHWQWQLFLLSFTRHAVC